MEYKKCSDFQMGVVSISKLNLLGTLGGKK